MDLASVACLERYRAHTENENNSHEKKKHTWIPWTVRPSILRVSPASSATMHRPVITYRLKVADPTTVPGPCIVSSGK